MTKIVKLKEAVKFAKENGYLLAVYKRQGDNFVKYDEFYTIEAVDMDRDIVVDVVVSGVNFNEFITTNKQYCFRLHNNCNVPMIIPIIQKV